jgi:hypothetical protein
MQAHWSVSLAVSALWSLRERFSGLQAANSSPSAGRFAVLPYNVDELRRCMVFSLQMTSVRAFS